MALTSVAELQTLIHEQITRYAQPLSTETLPVAQAVNRVLAQDIQSSLAIPVANMAAMDGYALPTAALAGSTWQIIGESAAGRTYQGDFVENCCIRIMTGAVLPEPYTTIVLKENVAVNDNHITLLQDCAAAEHIRYKGEEVAVGDKVLSAGRILRQADVMLLAALGCAEVQVYRKIKVAVLSTGDELHELGTPLTQAEHIYDSNRHTLMARLHSLPVEIMDLGWVHDDLESVMHTLETAMHTADVLISSGGVSAGDYDYMRQAAIRLGAMQHYKIAIKPGKPFVFGRMLKTWYFGLPGNPVAGFVSFDCFLKAALWQLSGANELPPVLHMQATLTEFVKKARGRMEIQRAVMARQADGSWLVTPTGPQGSHRVWGVSRANCYLLLNEDDSDLTAGSPVTIQPFSEVFL